MFCVSNSEMYDTSDYFFFFFSSRRRHTRSDRDWSSDVCSSDLVSNALAFHPTKASLLYASVTDGTVKEINVKRDSVLRTLAVDSESQGMAIAPDGSELYVADQAGGRLQIVSVTTAAVTSIALAGQ